MDNRSILTVSELSASLRGVIEGRFPFVNVAGEISNLHRPISGHFYFILKDEQAQIRAVLFKMQQRYLEKPLQDGMQVVCRGRVSVYEPRGEYQLIVDTVSAHGAGAQHQAFEALKQKLADEGLFAQNLKRMPPFLPRRIVLITSPQGAAAHDFIRIAQRRFPGIQLSIYPVQVQGEQAAQAMIEALLDLERIPDAAVAVLCRGGGSSEDLAAYNDEGLARAIRRAKIPVVSAVGHEIDFTIADFAADLRAATPSAAAELLVPELSLLNKSLAQLHRRLRYSIQSRLTQASQRLRLAQAQLGSIPQPLEAWRQRIKYVEAIMAAAMTRRLAAQQQQVQRLRLRVEQRNPRRRLDADIQRLSELQNRLMLSGTFFVRQRWQRLQQASAVLEALSPLATLARGYAIVRKKNRARSVVSDASMLQVGEQLDLVFHQGEALCVVEAIAPPGTQHSDRTVAECRIPTGQGQYPIRDQCGQ